MLPFRSACWPLAFALVVLTSSPTSTAQTAKPPACVERSWAGAVVIIPAAPKIWTQTPLSAGNTIAALTFDGRCVGAVRWDDRGAALTVWMDDPATAATDGLRADEVFLLAVWDDRRIPALQDAFGPYWLQSTFAYASYTSGQSPWSGVVPDDLFVVESHRAHRSVQSKAFAAATAAVALPDEVSLGVPYPNPARGRAHLAVGLPAPADVVVDVYDARGRRVEVAVRERLEAGTHTVPVDVGALASGLYVVRLTAGDVVRQRQMVVVD